MGPTVDDLAGEYGRPMPRLDDTQALVSERKTTHGEFREQFRAAQALKLMARVHQKANLDVVQLEALDMILMKVSRILTGDPTEGDHWDDIAGYAKLGAKFARGETH